MSRRLIGTAQADVVQAQNPLTVHFTLERVTPYGGDQRYDSWTGIYSPDYTEEVGVPFVLAPRLMLTDPDSLIEDGDWSGSIDAGWRWKLIDEEGVEKQITATTEGFTAGSDGSLTVRRNVTPDRMVTLRFEGELTDPRGSGQVYELTAEFGWRCESVSAAPPRLEIDRPTRQRYNPVRQRGDVEENYHFRLTLGGEELGEEESFFVVEQQGVNSNGENIWVALTGQYPAPGSESATEKDVLEYAFRPEGSNNSMLSVRSDLIGDGVRLRVRGTWRHRESGDWYAFTDASPQEHIEIVRWVPRVSAVIHNCSIVSTEGRREMNALTRLYMGREEIERADDVFDVEYTLAHFGAGGTVGKSVTIGKGLELRGVKTDIPAAGARPEVRVYLKGDWGAIELPDGSLLGDSEGNLILTRGE